MAGNIALPSHMEYMSNPPQTRPGRSLARRMAQFAENQWSGGVGLMSTPALNM